MMNLRLVFIDGEEERQQQWKEWFDDPAWNVVTVETALDAFSHVADVYVVDITSVSSAWQPLHAAYPVLSLALQYPGAVFIIVSAVSRGTSLEVIETIRGELGEGGAVILYGGRGDFKGVEDALREVFGDKIARKEVDDG